MKSDIPYFWSHLKRSGFKPRAIKMFARICFIEFISLLLFGRFPNELK